MNILENIATYKRDEIVAAQRIRPLRVLEQQIIAMLPPRGFSNALFAERTNNRMALIAEIKRASPSKGLIRADFEPAALAKSYTEGGAACLSVLTDGPSFQGAPEFVAAARGACRLPILRKDFMLDPYQVAEARALGADCILLIMAMISANQACELIAAAKTFSLDWLIEVHDAHELEGALALDSPLIGINNRDLKTFVTDLTVTTRLAHRVPPDRFLISESGIENSHDLIQLAKAGVGAVLVGESLMRQHDVAAATRTLLAPVWS